MRSWIIGSGTDCDVVVDSPLASGRHCELTQAAEGLWLKDLGSTNGTYVNGQRIAAPIRLTAGDSITLGRTVSLPWPPELTTSIRIGRLSDNDIVLDDPRVSGHHARLIVVAGFQTSIEDLGSSNGTFLNSPDRRVISPTPVTASDSLYFGTLEVPAARLLQAPINPKTREQPRPLATAVAPPRTALIGSPLALWVSEQYRWLMVWMAQAPVFAILIFVIFGLQKGTVKGGSVGQGIAATTFALALAAIWLGCSLAVAAGHTSVRDGKRLSGLALLCAAACAVLLTLVYWGTGLKGPSPTMWGVLTLSSLVGLFLGLTVSVPLRNWRAITALLVTCFATMAILGGWILPLPKLNLPLQYVAEAMPSRWAFEGLLLLESAEHRAHAPTAELDLAPEHDLVEGFFPAGSERMGIQADATALASMLIGLVALAVFISGRPQACP